MPRRGTHITNPNNKIRKSNDQNGSVGGFTDANGTGRAAVSCDRGRRKSRVWDFGTLHWVLVWNLVLGIGDFDSPAFAGAALAIRARKSQTAFDAVWGSNAQAIK
jgi:hypothetical protein